MESISVSNSFAWVASFFKKEIEHFVVLIVTAYVGWWLFHHLGGGVFGCFSAQKASKKPKKTAKCCDTASQELVEDQTDNQVDLDGELCTNVTEGSGFVGLCDAASSLATPPAEALRSSSARVAVEQQQRPVKEPKASKHKKGPPEKQQPEGSERELGRVVCWRDNGFGFIVDEQAERLFVRQTEVEGEEKLMPGQLVWFRRGKNQSNQATKALEVALVDVEVAKILRRAEKDGMPWSKLRTAITSGDESVLAKFKALAGSPASAAPSTSKSSSASAESTKAPACKVESSATDADLQAFLGIGSVEEMRRNLKYAPQWVQEKFIACHGA
eukprot:gnl/TRDRNA2_/TRDRNA2_182037_c0_seq1.p1 gnl/TRDRNA2_/TRDRNA2_182037_c0~~gnl/TRDRNA2_/TRDRNA2_182037_c0_seq1.p1  ORF type:complete len:329 (-),score=89.21 gnl/TRDRNA2_/TRDRNA2_182037_c0_seq1:286-1272(-)